MRHGVMGIAKPVSARILDCWARLGEAPAIAIAEIVAEKLAIGIHEPRLAQVCSLIHSVGSLRLSLNTLG